MHIENWHWVLGISIWEGMTISIGSKIYSKFSREFRDRPWFCLHGLYIASAFGLALTHHGSSDGDSTDWLGMLGAYPIGVLCTGLMQLVLRRK